MELWLIWFVFAAVSAVMEITVSGFNRLCLSAGFSGACVAALLYFPFIWQAVFFLLFIDVFAFFVRPQFFRQKEIAGGKYC